MRKQYGCLRKGRWIAEKCPGKACGYAGKKKDAELENGNVRMSAVAENIRQYIDMHYKEDISLQSVAEEMNYSDAYFCKIFKQCFDKSFIGYLTEYRLERAKQLLADVRINVKDISVNVGYRDSNYLQKYLSVPWEVLLRNTAWRF